MTDTNLTELEADLRTDSELLEEFKNNPGEILLSRGLNIPGDVSDAIKTELEKAMEKPDYDPAAITVSITMR